MIIRCKGNKFFAKSKQFIVVILLISMFFSAENVVAQNKVIKAKILGGQVLPVMTYSKIERSAAYGLELDYELLSIGKYDWEQQWGFPTFGVALTGMSLGNSERLGWMVGASPYFDWKVVNTRKFQLGLRLGVGVAFFTKDIPEIGSSAAGLVTTGLNMEFPIDYNFAIMLEGGTMHMNNGNFRYPNSTINVAYGSFGIRNRIGPYYGRPDVIYRRYLPYDMMFNISFSGGGLHHYDFNNLPSGAPYYKLQDNQTAFVANLHFDAVWKMTNWYALGPGFDVFYNGLYVKQGIMDNGMHLDDNTPNDRYLIENENFSNKFKVGLCLSNAFTMGRVTFLLDAGFYVFDPICNMYPLSTAVDRTKKRNFHAFYSFDPEQEDGWAYFRAGLRCRIVDNLFLKAAVKTHTKNFDHFEFGLGYTIPLRRNNYYLHKRTGQWRKYQILHPNTRI